MVSLYIWTSVTAFALLGIGAALFLANSSLQETAKRSLRSVPVAAVCFGSATVWFLAKTLQLGPAEEIIPKQALFLIFLVIAVGSWVFVKDFLAVRGFAALLLLAAAEILDAAFLKEPQTRLFLVSFTYVAILLALYLGASPFRLRDFFEWVFAQPIRHKIIGGVLAGYGLLLGVIVLTY